MTSIFSSSQHLTPTLHSPTKQALQSSLPLGPLQRLDLLPLLAVQKEQHMEQNPQLLLHTPHLIRVPQPRHPSLPPPRLGIFLHQLWAEPARRSRYVRDTSFSALHRHRFPLRLNTPRGEIPNRGRAPSRGRTPNRRRTPPSRRTTPNTTPSPARRPTRRKRKTPPRNLPTIPDQTPTQRGRRRRIHPPQNHPHKPSIIILHPTPPPLPSSASMCPPPGGSAVPSCRPGC